MSDQVDIANLETPSARAAARAKYALGDDLAARRLTDSPQVPIVIDSASADDKKEDHALALQEVRSSVTLFADEKAASQAVMTYFRGSNLSLTDQQVKLVAMLCRHWNVSPHQLYAFNTPAKNGQSQFIVIPHYEALIQKANQQHAWFILDSRPMTPAESETWAVTPAQIGAICQIVDVKKAQMARSLGLPAPIITGIGVWNKSATPPNGRTGAWVATKRALRDALTRLGVELAPPLLTMPDNVSYDPADDAYFISDTPPQALPDVIEGVIEPAAAPELPERPYAPDILKTRLLEIARTSRVGFVNNTDEVMDLLASVTKNRVDEFTQQVFDHVDKPLSAKQLDALRKWLADFETASIEAQAFLNANADRDDDGSNQSIL